MKITSVKTIVVSIPYDYGAPPMILGGRPRTTLDTLLVRVETDGGLVGWGDAFGVTVWPVTREAIEQLVAPLCIGMDALDRPGLMQRLERSLYHFGRSGPLQYALSGLDIALWDLQGKAERKPVHALIGPQVSSRLPVYASLLPYPNLELLGRYAARAVHDGYRHVKLHEKTPAAVAAARQAIGHDVELMVDVNCAFDLEGAKAFACAIESSRPMWLEEPIFPPDDFAAITALSNSSRIPLALGENVGNASEFERLLGTASGLTFAQPSAIKTGGITALVRVARAAQSVGVRLMPHSAYFGPGFLATMHVLSTLDGAPVLERFYCDLGAKLLGPGCDVTGGFVQVPDLPGLGFDPDPAVLAQFSVS